MFRLFRILLLSVVAVETVLGSQSSQGLPWCLEPPPPAEVLASSPHGVHVHENAAPLKCRQAKILALIPIRSGSKSVKDKNIRLIGGKPLVAHSIGHAQV